MYSLILVDDEMRVLEALRKIVPWEELNIRVIGLYDNAISALQTIIDERPDILVTDLMMPVMDGLELIARAKEMYPPIECLVLSGHEEFELARSAMACGVRGYLVKPCRKEELIESLRSCVKNIERNREHSREGFTERQSKVEEIYDRLMNLTILSYDFTAEQVRQIMEQYQDYGMLREAAIMAVVQHEMSAQKMQAILKTLAKNQTGDELIYCITDVLKQLGIQNQTTDPVVAKVVQYVYDNYHMPNLNLQYIADEVIYLTPRYIGRRFLNVMNIKFSDFLLNVRMEKAVAFLKRGDNLSTIEVAAKVGLGNNVQYFYRLFRQHTGMTIREYKEKLAEEKQSVT